tara:strand:- start:44 stop:289 length:246 start_codon:yes stop_codon:yes gene_type:complete
MSKTHEVVSKILSDNNLKSSYGAFKVVERDKEINTQSDIDTNVKFFTGEMNMETGESLYKDRPDILTIDKFKEVKDELEGS